MKLSESYRQLLITQRAVFGRDAKTLKLVNAEARKLYNKAKASNDEKLQQKLIEDSREACLFLRQNIVQGIPDASNPMQFKLQITEETEINDNDSIRKAKGKRLPRDFPKSCCQE